jgi:hypothetical protein
MKDCKLEPRDFQKIYSSGLEDAEKSFPQLV